MHGENAETEQQLNTFFEVAETWLGFYDEVRALAKGKQEELVVSLAEARAEPGAARKDVGVFGTLCV